MAATSMASTRIVLEALRKDNYENWSALVENYLVAEGLWHDTVVGDYKPDHNNPTWRSKNAKALHAIQLACGSETLGKIRQFKTSREVWNHLKATFSEDVRADPDIEQGNGRDIYRLHSDVKRGYWNDAKSYLIRFPDDIFSTMSSTGKTVLHVAVASGQERIVEELVNMGNQRLLMMQDKRGYTALALAAELTGNQAMAEWMVSKGGKDLLTVKTKDEDDDKKGEIPLLLASAKGHKQMTRYLFSITPTEVLFEDGGNHGVVLLTRCISAEIFDIAVLLLQHRRSRKLPLNHKFNYLRPLYALAHMPSAFPSGDQPGWWRRLIYKSLGLPTHIDTYGKRIEIISRGEPDEGPDTNILTNLFATALGKIYKVFSILVPIKRLCRLFGQFNQVNLSGSKKAYEKKINHYLVLEILEYLRKRVSKFDEQNLHKSSAYDAMLHAAKHGIIEFIVSMRRANPDLLWAMDKSKRGMFSHAILNRQEKVFQLIHEFQGRIEMIASHEDVFGNNMLHLAAELGPSSDRGSSSNAALQMQRELQWFNAVERIVPPTCKEAKNADGKKPREVFTKNHEELVKAGEKWARDTAGSFTLVGTLIITIMFAAAFTVPGGNNQDTGIPIFLRKPAFTVFILADAISLIMASSSVLSFIWILTSRYAEKDFLWKLPLKLLLGLITLFFSVASMMLAFVAALSMMLKGYGGVVIAAISLAIIPVLVLIPTLLILSFEILKSTSRSPDLLASKKKKSQD